MVVGYSQRSLCILGLSLVVLLLPCWFAKEVLVAMGFAW